MNLDFYQHYKDYSNIELLKIVKQPADYLPAAVASATKILSERQVTDEEIQSVDQFLQGIENSARIKKEKMDALKGKVADFFEPVLQPSEKVEPKKWVNIFLLVVALQYVWSIFKIVRRMIRLAKCKYCSVDTVVIVSYSVDFLTLLYIPLIFFLVFKRRRWGWILLFADNLFSLITSASQSYTFFKYQHIHHGDTASFLGPILIRTAFVFFLWREPIANHFGITDKTKKDTGLIVTAGSLIFIFITYMIFAL